MLICDNGPEFELKDFCKTNKIRLIHTETYQPTQNAKVENQNGLIRKVMRQNFIKNNNLNWIDHLRMISDNLNNRILETTKQKPNDLWRPKRTVLPEVKKELTDKLTTDKLTVQNQALNTITKKAEEQMNKTKKYDYKVGQKVRISIKSLSSQARKLIKAKEGKYLNITFTPELYTIESVIQPKNQFKVARFIVSNSKGEIIKEELKKNKPNQELNPKLFNGNDLYLVLTPDNPGNLTNNAVNKLNMLDFRYSEPEPEPPRPPRPPRQPRQPIAPVEPVARPQRNRKQNQFLKGFVQ
jgi:hypothetical protein